MTLGSSLSGNQSGDSWVIGRGADVHIAGFIVSTCTDPFDGEYCDPDLVPSAQVRGRTCGGLCACRNEPEAQSECCEQRQHRRRAAEGGARCSGRLTGTAQPCAKTAEKAPVLSRMRLRSGASGRCAQLGPAAARRTSGGPLGSRIFVYGICKIPRRCRAHQHFPRQTCTDRGALYGLRRVALRRDGARRSIMHMGRELGVNISATSVELSWTFGWSPPRISRVAPSLAAAHDWGEAGPGAGSGLRQGRRVRTRPRAGPGRIDA